MVAQARRPAGAWWGVRFDLTCGRRLAPGCFLPPPMVVARMLVILPAVLPRGAEGLLATLLRQAGRDPVRRLRAVVAGRLGAGQLRTLGVDGSLPVALVDAASWRTLVRAMIGVR